MNSVIRDKLKTLPAQSGVYLMLASDGEIIYVGKARNLKNRVSQYFHASGNKTEKTIALVSHIADFRYIITSGEVDALVLENNLIKQYTPKYNILLKDDKSYPFIRIDLREDFPAITVVRKLKNDGARYFGPYMQGINVREIMDLMYGAFQLRSCGLDLSRLTARHRPCLNFHIGRCLAPCAGKVSKSEYAKTVAKALEFLKGDDREVKDILTEKMISASMREDFELALEYRERLKSLEKLVRRQISALPKNYNMDIFAVRDKGLFAAVSMLVVRGGKILGGDNFALNALEKTEFGRAEGLNGFAEHKEDATVEGGQQKSGAGRSEKSIYDGAERINQAQQAESVQAGQSEKTGKTDLTTEGMLSQFIVQYYRQTPSVPDEIVVSAGLYDEKAIENYLLSEFGKKVNIIHPHQGVRRQLADMAENNAADYLANLVLKGYKKRQMTLGAAEQLERDLGLPAAKRIECYDISHISGTDKVASMVVFTNGAPDKNMYRRFKIKTVEGNDDFASMYETLSRRFARFWKGEEASFSQRPDLVVIDGGKGQLKYALEAVENSGGIPEGVSIISLAKREEEVFLPHRKEPVVLKRNSPSLTLLQRVRDEAHRFAVDYHTRLRNRRMSFSELQKIDGIGPKKTDILYKAFRSMAKIEQASEDELGAVSGISRADAQNIYNYFRDKK